MDRKENAKTSTGRSQRRWQSRMDIGKGDCVSDRDIRLKDGRKIEIYQDESPSDPREDCNLGIMVCMHRRYNLGDKHDLKSEDFKGWPAVAVHLQKEEKAVMLIPLYLLDHSGITMRAGRDFGDCDPGHWDSGMVGFIYTTREKLKEIGITSNFNAKHDNEGIRKMLMQEVEVYAQYLRGDVYGFTITSYKECPHCKHKEESVDDTCGGFYGDDWKTNGMLDHFPEDVKKELEAKT